MNLVITGGHHSSAIPVIKSIKETNPETRIYWIGHRRTLKGDKNDTLEYKEITALGIPFFDLKAGKVYKTFDLGRLFKVPVGFFQALVFLIKIKPDVILSFGGYLAVPVVIAGWFLGIPSVTHEQTVAVGYANKLIAYFVKKILISWPQSEINFDKRKTILVGIPIRDEITKILSNSFSSDNSLPTIYILGGKTGSHLLNLLVQEKFAELLSVCNVIHQCGDNSVFNDCDNLCSFYENIKEDVPGKYYPRKFILENEIGEAYAKSDLVISRAGAHTISELLILKKPCILIPIPWVSHNEQYQNASLLGKAGIAKILNEKDLSGDIFLEQVKNTLNSLSDLTLKDESLLSLLKSDSALRIANETLKLAQKH